MSTSPSWFDQEKFSRLVRKVGPKTATQPLPPAPPASQPLPAAPAVSPSATPAPEAVQPPPVAPSASQPLPSVPSASQRLPEAAKVIESAPVEPEGVAPIAPTTRISLVSKPPSLLAENRSLPALPRRTTPLPGLKTLFQNPSGDALVAPPSVDMPSVITQPLPEPPAARVEKTEKPEKSEKSEKSDAPSAEEPVAGIPKLTDPLAAGDDDLSGIWQKMALLNEELAQTIQERDHALGDINQLREQLRLADELVARNRGGLTADDVLQVARERDEAVAELKALKEKGGEKGVPVKGDSQKIQLPEGVTKTRELVFLTQERDQARKEYAELRKQLEALKREQSPMISGANPPPLPREDGTKVRKELEQQLEGFRQKLEEKNKEIADLKAAAAAAPAPVPAAPAQGEGDEKLRAEIATLKEQLLKTRDDASIAQRGLALSQKALQETRDALREATEGTSLSRHNFDNLKNECASLTQQNTVLQAQNEQLARELAAAKQRQSSGRIQI